MGRIRCSYYDETNDFAYIGSPKPTNTMYKSLTRTMQTPLFRTILAPLFRPILAPLFRTILAPLFRPMSSVSPFSPPVPPLCDSSSFPVRVPPVVPMRSTHQPARPSDSTPSGRSALIRALMEMRKRPEADEAMTRTRSRSSLSSPEPDSVINHYSPARYRCLPGMVEG